MAKTDQLQKRIESALSTLLRNVDLSSDAGKDAARKDISLAIKWEAVKLKRAEEDWGSGLNNGGGNKGDDDDAGLDDDGNA